MSDLSVINHQVMSRLLSAHVFQACQSESTPQSHPPLTNRVQSWDVTCGWIDARCGEIFYGSVCERDSTRVRDHQCTIRLILFVCISCMWASKLGIVKRKDCLLLCQFISVPVVDLSMSFGKVKSEKSLEIFLQNCVGTLLKIETPRIVNVMRYTRYLYRSVV